MILLRSEVSGHSRHDLAVAQDASGHLFDIILLWLVAS